MFGIHFVFVGLGFEFLLEVVLDMAFRDRGFDSFSRSNRRGG